MNSMTIGFIGCGNLGESILSGILNIKFATPDRIFICNRTEASNNNICKKYQVRYANAVDLIKTCDIILIGVKPNDVGGILKVISKEVTKDKIIVSLAAGIKIEFIENRLPLFSKVIRAMPNVSSSVCCGSTCVVPNKVATDNDTSLVVQLFNSVGKTIVLPESYIHSFIALCGSSPAFVFMFIEALSDGAVRLGFPRQSSYEMACQTLMGAAKMLQESGKVPAQLKDKVCSPGGTTIEGLSTLERGAFRSLVIEAMNDCAAKSKMMEDQNI
ncbi:unnamed protein product [Phytomonas sp. Hart1]|nr:unnamed protein product [Phytomonas sp. Hart1]|eukprot:CCW66764.1 unnamed protein product [Phytomonas sp. isolate Hart1]